MELTHFTFDVEDGIATVLLDRAGEPMNTIGPAIFDDFFTVIDRIETDPSIKAVVFGSAKKGNFLAGPISGSSRLSRILTRRPKRSGSSTRCSRASRRSTSSMPSLL